MPFRIGPWEIGLILVIILIIFGMGKLPQIGGAIGKGLHEFRKVRSGEYDAAETKAEHKNKKVATKPRLKIS
jgi:sec-independent protein translocase protein TatA